MQEIFCGLFTYIFFKMYVILLVMDQKKFKITKHFFLHTNKFSETRPKILQEMTSILKKRVNKQPVEKFSTQAVISTST